MAAEAPLPFIWVLGFVVDTQVATGLDLRIGSSVVPHRASPYLLARASRSLS